MRESKNGVVYFTDPGFFSEDVTMAFSTRYGGYSETPYKSLNLGYLAGDDKKNVLKNRIRFLEALNLDIFTGIKAGQIHGNHVEVVGNAGGNIEGSLLFPGYSQENTDGLITAQKNFPLAGTFADCVPLFFYESISKVIAISHAGWKGTRAGIAKKSIEKIKYSQEIDLKQIKVIIGPSIGKCCYEVSEEIYDQFKGYAERESFFDIINGSFYLDLWKANYLQLVEAGILPENILTSEICTSCLNEMLFSYRKEKKITGRMMGLIMLN